MNKVFFQSISFEVKLKRYSTEEGTIEQEICIAFDAANFYIISFPRLVSVCEAQLNSLFICPRCHSQGFY